jgi:hypothetical protein
MGSAKGFMNYVKSHFDLGTLSVVLGGLALPAIAAMLADRLNLSSYLARAPVLGGAMSNPWVQGAVGLGLTAAITYVLGSNGIITMTNARMANNIALGLFTAQAAVRQFPGVVGRLFPFSDSVSSVAGYRGGYLGGYRGGYLGYLGSEHGMMGETTELLPAPSDDSALFGVGSAPKFNVF